MGETIIMDNQLGEITAPGWLWRMWVKRKWPHTPTIAVYCGNQIIGYAKTMRAAAEMMAAHCKGKQ